MAFGNTTSWVWLITIFLSLFKDVFAVQPIKIFLISFVTSLLWKRVKVQDETDFQRKIRKKAVDQLIIETHTFNGFTETGEDYLDREPNSSVDISIENRQIAAPAPPSAIQLENARIAILRKKKLWSLIKELFTCIIIVTLALQMPFNYFNETRSTKIAFEVYKKSSSNISATFNQVMRLMLRYKEVLINLT